MDKKPGRFYFLQVPEKYRQQILNAIEPKYFEEVMYGEYADGATWWGWFRLDSKIKTEQDDQLFDELDKIFNY